MDTGFNLGDAFKDFILLIAGLLKDSSAPGWVSLALIITLTGLVLLVGNVVSRRRAALVWLGQKLSESGDDLCQEVDALTAELKAGVGANRQRKVVVSAWEKYRETLVIHQEGDQLVWRNSVRPSQFLNLIDMNFSLGGWRLTPGMFVSVGLLCTFLGLVSALNSMGGDEGITSQTMQTLLTIASAKFVMSLTGLLCSIIFSVVLRIFESRLDRAVFNLCTEIEDRLKFISLEDLANEQLNATIEQREHFRSIALEMVAELGRPLREDLPVAISTSISTAMAPLLEKVQQTGVDNIGGLVQDLSARFSTDVGAALSLASRQLEDAGEKISRLADRLDASSGRMGSEMDTAVSRLAQAVEALQVSMGKTTEQAENALTSGAESLLATMNKSLDAIRVNTSEGAQAIGQAAVAMLEASEKIRTDLSDASNKAKEAAERNIEETARQAGTQIGSAGQAVVGSMSRTAQEIAENASEVSEKIKQDLLGPLQKMSTHLDTTVANLQASSGEFGRLSDGIRAGAQASSAAAETFRGAADELKSAIGPVRSSTDSIEASVRKLAESTYTATETIKTSAERTAKSAAEALESASVILGHEAKAIEATLKQVSVVLERMDEQGDHLDTIDEKLGNAFDQFNRQVASAVEGMRSHVSDLQENLMPALDTLKEVVEQAEQFVPQSVSRGR